VLISVNSDKLDQRIVQAHSSKQPNDHGYGEGKGKKTQTFSTKKARYENIKPEKKYYLSAFQDQSNARSTYNFSHVKVQGAFLMNAFVNCHWTSRFQLSASGCDVRLKVM
jgi:hypothetical protein